MSMFDGFLKKGFRGATCKTLLKLVIPRIKIMRNKREAQLKQMRKDIAKLIENGEEATARIRVEHIIREEKMMAAQEIIELFCELIAARLPIIEAQKECPLDLKEAISTVCFAAPRCPDLVELPQIQMMFAMKYGKEFVAAATELMPDCGVNRQVIELLSVRAPSPEAKLKVLKEIAEEHELEWDPADAEAEFLKPHEDLLNGPSQFISGSKLPLPKQKHNESIFSAPTQASHEQFSSGTDFDALDLPEVPLAAPKSRQSSESGPELSSFQPTSPALDPEQETTKSTESEGIQYHHHANAVERKESHLDLHPSVTAAVDTSEQKQFIPFTSPPSSSPSFLVEEGELLKPAPTLSRTASETSEDLREDTHINAYETPQEGNKLLRTKSEFHVDLQDVLVAAQTAAETAERAAAAARSAASLMQVRISEFNQRKDINQIPDRCVDTPDGGVYHPAVSVTPSFNQSRPLSEGTRTTSYDSPKMENEAGSSPEEQALGYQSAHQPQRLTSLEDDPYFSYPNLFSRSSSSVRRSSDESLQSTQKPQ